MDEGVQNRDFIDFESIWRFFVSKFCWALPLEMSIFSGLFQGHLCYEFLSRNLDACASSRLFVLAFRAGASL